ncbi:MAG: efflux RND transporter periplasmic adaptor subunit [Planctomycetota bacterium]
MSQAEASLRLARLGLEDTLLRAEWTGEVERVVVGQRYVDPGSTLRPGDPVVTLVSLERLRAVVSVTERDYTKLRIGQVATLSADAIEGRTFEATITRIAPVFDEASRQARIEIEVDNRAALLKPGMFVRARLILEERPAAVVAPLDAITRRDGEDVVFVYDEQETVSMIPVRMGIEEDGRVELIADRPIDGARVVTLGHQLLSDGSLVNVPGDAVAEFEPAGALPPVEKAERAAE